VTRMLTGILGLQAWPLWLCVFLAASSCSSGEQKLAFVRRGDIWICNVDGTEQEQLTFDGTNTDPAWTPNGTQIVFTSTRDGIVHVCPQFPGEVREDIRLPQIHIIDADGHNRGPLPILRGEFGATSFAFLGQSRELVFVRHFWPPGTGPDYGDMRQELFLAQTEPPYDVRCVAPLPCAHSAYDISSDGRYFCFNNWSNCTGEHSLFIVDLKRGRTGVLAGASRSEHGHQDIDYECGFFRSDDSI